MPLAACVLSYERWAPSLCGEHCISQQCDPRLCPSSTSCACPESPFECTSQPGE